jgi:hypothetical protein
MSAAYYPQVQKIYVAYYGRPADPAGLQYWAGQLAANGGNLTSIINAFGNSSESTALYAGASDSAKVTAIYQQLFNRAPDGPGLAFYTAELTAGRMTAASIALNVANGATGVDATYLANKVTVGTAFTDALTVDSAAAVAYTGTTAITAARSLITGVTTSAATTNVASTITSIKSGGSAVDGQTFTLTTSAEELVTGTAKSDNFVGLVSATTTKTTFNTGDTYIDGSTSDSDVLTLTAQADVTDVPTIKGIERINVNVDAITATDTVLNMATTSIDAATYSFDVTRTGSAVSGVTLTDLKGGSVINASNDFTAISVDASAATDSLTVNASANGSVGSPITVTGAGAMADLTVQAAGSVSVTAAAATGAVNVAGSGSVTVSATAAVASNTTTTSGNITLTDVDSASIVKATASGNITSAAAALKAVSNLSLIAGGTVTATLATGATALKTATLSGKGTANSFRDTDGVVVEMNLSGNGGAATFDLSGGTTTGVLNTINITGSQAVTVKIDGKDIEDLITTTGYGGANDALAVVDSSNATSRLVIQTTKGSADLSSSTGLDEVELAVDQTAETVTLSAGANVIVSADQGAGATSVTLAGPAATKATNTLTITLDDGTDDANVADFAAGTLVLDDIKTVTIDASVDTTAAGTSAKHSILGLTGSDQNSNVTINGGVNALDLAAVATSAINLGTGKLTVTGSGAVAVTEATGVLTVGEFDGSAATGVITAAGLTLGSAPVFKTGSGADVISLITAVGSANSTIESGAGNDTITLFGGDYGNFNRSFNMGDGSGDVLGVATSAVLAANSGKTITLSGIETLQFNGNSTVGADLLTGQTYKLQADGASKTYSITVEVGSTATIALASLVETTETAKTVGGMTFVTDASSKSSAYSITGMDNAINTITGSTAADTLIGGSKADTINGGLGDTLTGGAGNDTFNVSGATGASATSFVTITDFVTNSSATASVDVLNITAGTPLLAAALAGYSLTDGIFTKTGASLSDFVTAVLAAEAGGQPEDVYAFATGSDLYIYSVGADETVTTDNVLVKLTGVVTLGLGVEVATIATAGYVTVT